MNQLDPEIAALCDACPAPASPFDWTSAYMLTGCTRETYFAGLASMLLMAGIRLVSGHRATQQSARRARHLAYSAGIATPPARQTAADRRHAELVAWNLVAA